MKSWPTKFLSPLFLITPLALMVFNSPTALAGYWQSCQQQNSQKCAACSLQQSSAQELLKFSQLIHSEAQAPLIESVTFKNNELQKHSESLSETKTQKNFQTVALELDPSVKHQEIWGFGASITDACLANLDTMKPNERKILMEQLFAKNPGANFSYLRVPLGANDFSIGNYSLNDTPKNQPDPQLKKFNKEPLQKYIRFLKEAKALNPDLKILVSPWSPPAWMKDSAHLSGGQLKPEHHESYARYLEKSVQAFQDEGLKVDHLTILNEPLVVFAKKNWDFPQSYMSVKQQKEFLSEHMAPVAFKNKNFPKILVHDHNWGDAVKTEKILKDPKIKPMIAGVAMHCYEGDFTDQEEALSHLQPVNTFNSECSSSYLEKDKAGSFNWWLTNHSLDSLRAGSSGALGWNLCLDQNGGPQNNGCKDCQGLVTIDQKNKQKVIYNPEFEALAFASRALQNGAVRIQSNNTLMSGVTNVAFKNPDGKITVLFHNTSSKKVSFAVKVKPCQNTLQVEVPENSATSVIF